MTLDDPLRIDAVRNARAADGSEALDRLTALGAAALDAPVAAITLLDGTQQYFLSHYGLPESIARARVTSVGESFCRHVVLGGKPFESRDATRDPLCFGSPLVLSHGMRAYAGVPLRSREGYVFGAFCVVDYRPRDWTVLELRTLADLGRAACAEIERCTRATPAA